MKFRDIIFLTILYTTALSQHIDGVGCSITRNGWPGHTDNLMKENGYAWRSHNYGVPGAGVVQNAYKNQPEYTEVVCREAQIVVILLGANDWGWYSVANQSGKDKWKSEYKNLVKEFKKFSTVVLGYLINRVSVNGSDVTIPNATMDEMNIVIDQIANEYGLAIIDFKTAIGTDPAHFWASDGLHPNYLGSRLMGEAAYEYLKTIPPISGGVNSCQPQVVETMSFDWVQLMDTIHFTWGTVAEATHYKLSKAHLIDGVWHYWWDDTITTTEYLDKDFIIGQDYFCGVQAYKNSTLIGESPIRTVVYYEYLGIDDEYWEAVRDYEEQTKIGWFGCRGNSENR